MKDKEILETIKKKLEDMAWSDPSWRLIRGRESLSAADVLQRLDKDKELRKFLVDGFAKLGGGL